VDQNQFDSVHLAEYNTSPEKVPKRRCGLNHKREVQTSSTEMHIHTLLTRFYHRVSAVTPTSVTYSVKNEKGEIEERTIPSNFVLWSTGIAMNPFTSRVSNLLPNQVHKKVGCILTYLCFFGRLENREDRLLKWIHTCVSRAHR